ncbi:hypothetical protein ASPCAL10017 [Aspergillus calidoustus]|uniref:Uncharacterized protein n=1 Tax=Aspergillus calidoustus TaxID=454130 RepID=A0A0U5G7E1_ASPCI|nr:hypothetical protein ASPCAL10017 [Aspergillus calidoustus]
MPLTNPLPRVHSHIQKQFQRSTERIHREYQIIRLRRMLKGTPAIADAEAYSSHHEFVNENPTPLTAIASAAEGAKVA